MITDQMVASFRRDGYLSLPGAFGASEVARITSWIDEIQAWPETPGRHMMYFEQSRDGKDARLLNRLENFVPFHDRLAELCLGDALLGGCSALFDEPAVLFKEKVNFKLPGGDGFEPHQDVQAGWDDYVSIAVTAMLTIDETTIENGCLEIARWPHHKKLIGELWRPLQPDELRDVDFVALPSKPGDVVFFDSFIPHQSAPNMSDTPRRVLYVTYNPASDGDHRDRYYADKRQSYPPDCERDPDKVYEYKV
jgi:2-aminoethylphosphonate dioxygenase